jgi:hypothetical protein
MPGGVFWRGSKTTSSWPAPAFAGVTDPAIHAFNRPTRHSRESGNPLFGIKNRKSRMQSQDRPNMKTILLATLTILVVALALALGRYYEIQSHANFLISSGFQALPYISNTQEITNALVPLTADIPSASWFKTSASKNLILDFTPSPVVQAAAIFCSVIIITVGASILLTNRSNKSQGGSIIAAILTILGLMILVGDLYPHPSPTIQIDVSSGIVTGPVSNDSFRIDVDKPADIKIDYLEGVGYAGPFSDSGWHGYIRDITGQYQDLFKVGMSQQALDLKDMVQNFINSHGQNI